MKGVFHMIRWDLATIPGDPDQTPLWLLGSMVAELVKLNRTLTNHMTFWRIHGE